MYAQQRTKRPIGLAGVLLLAGLLGGCPSGLSVGAGGGPPAALLGVWRASFVDPLYGPGAVELILMNNLTFQQQTVYQAGGLVTLFGTYRVFPSEALLRLDIQRGEPAQACGPLGCTDIIYPAGESHGYTLIDANTLILQNVNCAPETGAVCEFDYIRVS